MVSDQESSADLRMYVWLNIIRSERMFLNYGPRKAAKELGLKSVGDFSDWTPRQKDDARKTIAWNRRIMNGKLSYRQRRKLKGH
jgi:hypothetical protein